MANSYNELFGLGGHSEDASLQGWWTCADDDGSTTVVDSSDNGLNLTATVATSSLSTTGPNAYLTKALQFLKAGGEYARAPYLLPDGENVSLVGWMKSPATTGHHTIISLSNDQAGTSLYLLGTNNGTSKYSFRARQSTLASADGTNTTLDWIALGGVRESATNRLLYESGLSAGSNTQNITPAGLNYVDIGRWGDSSPEYGDIEVADIGFFTRVLTEQEVGQHANGPEAINILPPAAPTGTPDVGQTLTAENGSWGLGAPFSTGTNGTITFTYQWVRSATPSGPGSDIAGATAQTYLVDVADENQYLACRVRGFNLGGFDSLADTTSAYTAQVTGGGGPTTYPITGAANLGTLIGSATVAIESPTTYPITGAANLGTLTGSATVSIVGIPVYPISGDADLGTLTATATVSIVVPGVTYPITGAANLGTLTGTANVRIPEIYPILGDALLGVFTASAVVSLNPFIKQSQEQLVPRAINRHLTPQTINRHLVPQTINRSLKAR